MNKLNNYYRGLIIVYPHGSLIINGEKILLVKSRPFTKIINKKLLLIENKLALGYIILTNMYPINKKEFNKLKYKHLITNQERIKWWPNKYEFYAYPIKIIKIFKHPIKVDYPTGPQVTVKPENIIFY